MIANLEEKTWSLLYRALVTQTGLRPTDFQLLAPFIPWNWPDLPKGFTTSAQYDFCAGKPLWSAVAAEAGTAPFDNDYARFLSLVLPQGSDPKLNGQITAQEVQAQEALRVYGAVRGEAREAYEETTAGRHRPSFTIWLLLPAGRAWRLALEPAWAVYLEQMGLLAALVAQGDTPGLTTAFAAYENPIYSTAIPLLGLSGFPPVPAWSVALTPEQWLRQVGAGGGQSAGLSFANAQPPYDYAGTWAGGAKARTGPFWEIEVDGSWRAVEEFTRDENLTATVDLPAWDTVPITAGFWYDGSFTAFRKNGPFLPGYSGCDPGDGSVYLWGEGGVLDLLKTGLCAVFQPSVTVTVSASTFERFLPVWDAATGLRAGPFQWGAAAGGPRASTWTKSSAEGTFRAVSTAESPQIFGVTVQTLNVSP